MARFIGRWLADSIRLGLALLLALAAMQLPALAHGYVSALQQVALATERDIAERQEIARQFYRLPLAAQEAEVMARLREAEPANAAGLVASRERMAILRATHDRIAAASPLIQPVLALWDGLRDARADKHAILMTTLESHVPAVMLSAAPATYGLAGLMLGLLLGELLLTPFRRRSRHAA
ncbi:DUF2937 family protein [Roseomonas sp. M0104]|uniref:DUF2937 family protein n=1 Tax=Teichococcus coralli TaxID=2545983 RepID=A0A845B875_9PROT|nr:DUF2937 family protein [Pseudoroseomonas coralli]MXP63371.1 DUF2937 family protein [Pseudoroseomonas coralli]